MIPSIFESCNLVIYGEDDERRKPALEVRPPLSKQGGLTKKSGWNTDYTGHTLFTPRT